MSRVAVIGATVLDTAAPRPEPQPRTIVIEDGRVAGLAMPETSVDAAIVDARGSWAIPGLIDCHFHPFLVDSDPRAPRHQQTMARGVQLALRNLETWLASGVTTVRCTGAHENLDLELRDMLRAGAIAGPRLYACGSLLAQTGGIREGNENIAREFSGPDAAMRAARDQLKAGVDQLKIYSCSTMAGGGARLIGPPGWPQLNQDEIAAIVTEGNKAGVPSCAHAVSLEAVLSCLRAGVQCIEHATQLDDEAIALLREGDVTIVPTLTIAWSLATFGGARGFPPHLVTQAAASLREASESMMRARRAGVRVATGTDADNAQALLREECRLMVEAGCTPYEALQSATIHGATVLRRRNELGSLEPGRWADLVLLEADPLAEIGNLARVRAVMQGGRIVT